MSDKQYMLNTLNRWKGMVETGEVTEFMILSENESSYAPAMSDAAIIKMLGTKLADKADHMIAREEFYL